MVVRHTGWRLVLPCLMLLLAATAVVEQAAAAEEERFDCHQLADWAAPTSAQEWFERSLWANHCYVFRLAPCESASTAFAPWRFPTIFRTVSSVKWLAFSMGRRWCSNGAGASGG